MLTRIMALLTGGVALLGGLFVGMVFLDFQPNALGGVVFWLYGGWRLGRHIYRQVRKMGVLTFFTSLRDKSGTEEAGAANKLEPPSKKKWPPA
jgi:hypothetical protein